MQWPPTIDLKFCLLNAENLFLLFDQPLSIDPYKITEAEWQRLSTSVYANKSLRKTIEIAKCLKEVNADIILLCEVGGIESLKNFNRYFLNEEYSVCLLEGNSNRNIDVGYLIKKPALFYFDLHSNKSRIINFLYPHEIGGKLVSHKFSRDVSELRLFAADKEKPFLIILLTHLKSRLDPERIDPSGFLRRSAELRSLLDIYVELSDRYPQTPMMIAGDMNGNASYHETDEEFRPIYDQTDLQDVLEINNTAIQDRATFYQVRNAGRADGRQIDFAFLSNNLKRHFKPQSALVYRYKDHRGLTHDTPTSLEAKLLLPSDHYPLVFTIEKLPC